MQSQIRYIELKTGYCEDGPAWIAKVEFSKTGRTVYFNGQALRQAHRGNYVDVETGELYWISGIKRNGQDRHSCGNGKIWIEKRIVAEYLGLVDFDVLPPTKYELIEIAPTDLSKFASIENEKAGFTFDFYRLKEKEIFQLSDEELHFMIDASAEREKNSMYNKGRRFIKKYRMELEAEFEIRTRKIHQASVNNSQLR